MRLSGNTGISVIVLAAALLFAIVLGSVASSYDFRAFYCAAGVALHHGNPYNDEPLHSCERALPTGGLGSFSKTTTLPAPVPGYAIAFFIPLSLLPFTAASHLWTFLLYVAIGISIVCLAQLTGLTLATAVAAFLLSLCAASIGLGESVPICVAAICIAALLAAKGKWVGASLAAAASLIEPHLGLPVIVSLAIWVPRTRVPLIAAALGLITISIALLGPAGNIEYLTQVLPAHALSEIGSDAQLSLSVILRGAGADARQAIAIGTLSYFFVAASGIAVAGVLARRLCSEAFLVLTPAAISLIGGTFIHVTQMAAAIPLAMMLTVRAPRYRTLFLVATLLLAVPWRIVGSSVLITAALIVVFSLAWGLSGKRILVATAAPAIAILLLFAVNVWMRPPPMQQRLEVRYSSLIDARYAEASWARYNEEYLSTGAPDTWWRRVPTWLGLLLLSGGALTVVHRSRAASEVIASV